MSEPSHAIDPENRTTLAAAWPPTAAVAAEAGHRPMSPMDAIRRKCLDCCVGQQAEVRLCEAIACPLWPFRAGRHPYTKTRLQQADPDARAPGGPQVPANAPPSRNGPQEASFGESGAILASTVDRDAC
jgi:hypothetical protein